MRFSLIGAFVAATIGMVSDLRAGDAQVLEPGMKLRVATLSPPASPDHPDAVIGSPIGSNSEGVTLRGPDGQLLTLALPGKRLQGKLVGSDADALSLKLEGVKEAVRVPRASITVLEASRGRNLGKGAAIGFLGGFALGYTVAKVIDNGEKGWITAEGLGLVFAVPGAVLGVPLAAQERWQVIDSERVKVGLGGPIGPGPSLNVSIRF